MTSPNDIRLFAAELRPDLPTLDLHGSYLEEALDKLELFIYDAYRKDSAARIIYGFGSGQLGKSVTLYLQRHPLVATIQEQGGSCLVIFSK